MQGHNKRFMENPAQYLGSTPLRVRARADPTGPFTNLNPVGASPVFQFDLRPAAVGVELIPFTAHAKTHPKGTQRPITAYWLDYISAQTCSVQLVGPTQYLFTPMLDGCYIGVANNRVVHVAGDVPPPTATVNMRAYAAAALGAQPIVGFDSNPADATQFTFVGVRGAAGWTWYVQGHEIFYGAHGTLEPVFNGGPSVITVNNLAHG
jgi:hypothetical protein